MPFLLGCRSIPLRTGPEQHSRERERVRERQRERDRETERDRERDRETEREKEKENCARETGAVFYSVAP